MEYERHEIDKILPSIKNSLPSLIYKYRVFEEEYHRQILTDNIVWFSHPKSLNDPYDVRVKLRIDPNEVYTSAFAQKMYDGLKNYTYNMPADIDYDTWFYRRLKLIQSDPEGHFKKNMEGLRSSNVYDEIGILSLTFNCFSPAMWTFYANHFRGICIGLSTIDLFSDLKQSTSFVEYNDEPILHSFLNDDRSTAMKQHFYKEMKWKHEQEYRFFTYDIRKENDRAMQIKTNTIKEIIVGSNISKDTLQKIIDLCIKKYNHTVNIYEIVTANTWYTLEKRQIPY